MRPEACALILLASGLSERFGLGNKLMAELGGKPLTQHVIDNAALIKFGAKIAVVSSDDIAPILKSNGYSILRNDSPEKGQGHALSLGAKAAKADGYEAACVMLADMPFVEAEHIENLFLSIGDLSAVMSEFEGIQMPPAVFRGAAFESLINASGDRGAKGFLDAKTAGTCPVSKRAAMDIDTPADLAAARLGV